MTVKEFERLEANDNVKVKEWEEVKDFMPEYLRKYCGENLLIYAINRENENILLKNKNGDVILDGFFNYKMLELNRTGYLTYSKTGERCGVIGEKTKMYDYDGRTLYVGDIVTIKASDNVKKQADREIFDFLGSIGFIQSPFNPITVSVIENDGLHFVCGIKDEYNDTNQDSNKWIVQKVVDHSAVMNNAVIREIYYCLPLFNDEEKEDEKERAE